MFEATELMAGLCLFLSGFVAAVALLMPPNKKGGANV